MEDGARTRDTRNHNPMLYRLSYIHHRKPNPSGAPDRNRTCNPRLRRPVLYPVELRAQCSAAFHALRTSISEATQALGELVGVEGFEPTTSSSQSWRATRLRYTPQSRCGTTPTPTRYDQHPERSNLPTHHCARNIDARNKFGRRIEQWRARKDSNLRPPGS